MTKRRFRDPLCLLRALARNGLVSLTRQTTNQLSDRGSKLPSLGRHICSAWQPYRKAALGACWLRTTTEMMVSHGPPCALASLCPTRNPKPGRTQSK